MDEPIVVRAPGRVNLIGEHTDYNDGFVLPAAIDLEIRISFEPTLDREVELRQAANGAIEMFDLADIGPPRGTWLDYPAGVANELLRVDVTVAGLRGRIDSSLPVSAGLSSSAALELASAWALMAAANPEQSIDRLDLAQLCQRAENDYVGVSCGLMDQFAVSCGVAGHALLLDCRSLEHRAVPIPADIAMVIVDSGVARRLVASEYNTRRDECERGVAVLAASGAPVASLRDASLEMLDRARSELGEVVYRRCRHVVEENARVLAAVDALEAGDRSMLGELFAASHASLRDLYEVSAPELDCAVDIAQRTPGVIAARMTGAGFGGCTVNLVEADAVASLFAAIDREYSSLTGAEAHVMLVHAAAGAGLAVE